jgi:hypothetical protein
MDAGRSLSPFLVRLRRPAGAMEESARRMPLGGRVRARDPSWKNVRIPQGRVVANGVSGDRRDSGTGNRSLAAGVSQSVAGSGQAAL